MRIESADDLVIDSLEKLSLETREKPVAGDLLDSKIWINKLV